MNSVLLDPTGELQPVERHPIKKVTSLSGLKLGLLDISKARGDIFLDRLDALFVEAGAVVFRYKKPTFARPAPISLVQEIVSNVDAVIEGLAD
jgi:hypothetical protein